MLSFRGFNDILIVCFFFYIVPKNDTVILLSNYITNFVIFCLFSKETSLWTGIKKGPPRKLKFPQPDVVVEALQEALKAE